MNVTDAVSRQAAFARHLRDPGSHAAPADLDPVRVAIYRDLFFNNVEGLLSSFFPVLRSLYAQGDWLLLVRAFYAGHSARTPYFLEVAQEFIDFLEKEYQAGPTDPPFLRELAHYEWLELVLDVAEDDIPVSGFDPDGDCLRDTPVLNPVAVLTRYQWPVHRVSAQSPGIEPEETWLLVWRDRADQVRFQELNTVTARLYSLARDQPASTGSRCSGRMLAEQIARELAHADAGLVVSAALQVFLQWQARDVVLGFVAAPSPG